MGVLAAAAGVMYAALALPWPGWRRVGLLCAGLLAALGFHLAAQALAPSSGLKAAYWPGATPNGAPERSTDFPWLSDATRIDASLDLRGEEFGVYFFNDASRFNFGADVQPGRDQLPFSVRWDGWLAAQSSGPRRFVLESNGPAQVWLDQTPLPGSNASVDVSAGLHQLRVDYARPEAKVPMLRLQWQREPAGELVTVGGDDVRWRDGDPGAAPGVAPLPGDTAASVVASVLDVLAILVAGVVAATWLTLGGRRLWRQRSPAAWWRAALGLLPLAFLAYGLLLEAPIAGRATILSGLDDWLIYESSARDILLNGLLMDAGQGHAAPFYGQPLYPYALALAHKLTGESLFGPIALQFAALGAVVTGTAVLARRCFGGLLDGLVAAAALLVLLQLEPEHFKIARQLFNENLYMPLVMASLVVLVGLARRDRPPQFWKLLLAGGLLGLTAISRSQFLLCVPFALLVLWLAWRRLSGGWTGLLAAALVGIGLVVAIVPVTARNWIVSEQFVPISSSGGASLLEFHRPPPGLIDQQALQNDPLYNALHLDLPTRTVVAFARSDPRGYVATLLPLAAHSVGLPGRNDPGVYWPLLATTLLYLGSFALGRTRRLHVWPVHAFVGTHLLILTLFEADTYGYRLVMPMYAPMVAVAAQVPLEMVRAMLRSRAGAAMRSGEAPRAARFAVAGWSALAVAALAWQAGSLAQAWPDREASLHGLGGTAAHAVETADRVGAQAIYVASIDGTPRRFGAGSLPGLRYPWIKWFDPLRSLPLAPAGTTAVYMLAELRGQATGTADLSACLGAPDAASEVVISAESEKTACASDVLARAPLGATFDGLARIDALSAPPTSAAGAPLETRLVWQPLVAHPEPRQISVQLNDPIAGDGTLWGNGTLELYPAQEWQTDEAVLSRIPVATDATAIPQDYRISVGMSPPRANAPPDLATWQGTRTDRVPVASVALTPGDAPPDAALPVDMRALEGPPLVGGGLQLIAARPLPPETAVGSPLRVGLLWRAVQDGPSATQVRVRLVDGGGEVLQESVLPLLGGRAAPSALHAGNVVRDEQSIVVDARVPDERVSLVVALEDATQRLGSLNLTGRAHMMDTSGAAPLATFGSAMDLLNAKADPASLRAGEKLSVTLSWRGAARMQQAYKVFVHVLDPSGQHVVAQRDAEPKNGDAPTTSWVPGEVLEDAYALDLPGGLPAGEYPVEIGVYDPRSGDRLNLASGDNHLVLPTRVTVR
jgi:hypothetical protein